MKKKLLFSFVFLFGLVGLLPQSEAQVKKAVVKHGRGYKPNPEMLKANHAGAFARHGYKMKDLPVVTLSSFDVNTAYSSELPTDDQGQCGDCFGVGTFDGISSTFVVAGLFPNDGSGRLSSQYGLDSGAFQGGCNGGDPAQVVQYVSQNGAPLTSAYGFYSANPGRVKSITGMTLYGKGLQWGYCASDQGQGIATTQEIKNAMVYYKAPIIVCLDASECDSYQWPSTMTGNGQSVDHVVLCSGWDDNHDNGDGSKGAFIGKNQWGQASSTTVSFQSDPWGQPGTGRFWIKYGSDSWGTEAIWATMNGAPPVVPPTPGPPAPNPPVPVPPTPTPVPPTPTCIPTFHVFGMPHFRCGSATRGLFRR